MKIYFSASVRGDKVMIRKIYHLIEELGHEHTSQMWETDFPERAYKISQAEMDDHAIKAFKKIDRASMVILESTMPSLTIGFYIQYAIDHKIPVLSLYKKGSPIGITHSLEATNDKVLILEYDEENIEETLKNGIEYLKDNMETRFTLILPAKIVKYLDKVAKSGKSRSEYIRELIEKDIEEE